MPQSLSKVYVHIVFSTKHRQPLIDHKIEDALFAYIGGICQNLECHPICVGGYLDHVHIVCTLSRKIPIMKLLEEVKKSSSRWIKSQPGDYSNFYWQDGYGIFSVRPIQLNALIHYVQNQKWHHQRRGFQEEYREYLDLYGVEYDERYVWD